MGLSNLQIRLATQLKSINKLSGSISLLVFLVAFLIPMEMGATHNRAGEIIYTLTAPLTYEVTVITYTKRSGNSGQADRDSLEVFWGDGNTSFLIRTNGPIVNGFPNGVKIFDDIWESRYQGTYQYAGPPIGGYYVISMLDPNRIGNIKNINGGTSVNTPFYLEDTLRFFDIPSIGLNSSPVLLNPPIDFANVNDTFYHNPNAWDAEGDSLYYQLIPPKSTTGVDVPNYEYPDQVPIPNDINNRFTINSSNGQITWATPQETGIYNIAILIREYREGFYLGSIIRDMQIIVEDEPNDPPQIALIRDTCIRAGDQLNKLIEATDPDIGQTVTLIADGGPMQVTNSPAIFSAVQGNPASGNFSWQTLCEHIRAQPYQVVFKASDNYETIGGTPVPLVDIETWEIQVIPPPPEGLTATVNGSAIDLTWSNPYECASFENFQGVSVWRKIGCDSLDYDYCKAGLEGTGFVEIASGLTTYTYTDTDVDVGQVYAYRVIAHFAETSDNGALVYDAVISPASDEACAELRKDVPIITHVSVLKTDDTDGQIYVSWTKPSTSPGNLDTLQHPGPYSLELFRSEGFPGAGTPQLIHSVSANDFTDLNDTTFIDSVGLNTVVRPYSYSVKFTASTGEIGETSTASSVFLSIDPTDQALVLSWQEDVPWSNEEYHIFRFDPGTQLFDSIAVTNVSTYTDTGLINDSSYCYYVRSFGGYTSSGIVYPIINLSQEACGVPIDTVPPCPPTLAGENDCGSNGTVNWDPSEFVNRLSWTAQTDDCDDDVSYYKIHFYPLNATEPILVDSTTELSYVHNVFSISTGLAGCYEITAVDSNGNEGIASNRICLDNCPLYELPNAFSPNGDGQNDFFHPFLPYRFVESIEMKIYNRWGNLIFETTDPDIMWDGRNQNTGEEVGDGVYFYEGYVTEIYLSGNRRRPLPPNDGGGAIHVIRD